MSVNSKRKMELSSAMAAVNNTSDLKRKLVFSKVLAATEAENSSPRIFGAREAPREKSQVQNVSNNFIEDIATTNNREATDDMVDEISGRISGLINEKRTRGLTRGLNAQKYTRKYGEKSKIIIPEGINKPVGEHSSKHATQIGVLIRLEAPMQVDGWKNISDDRKQDLFRKLTNKLSYEVEKPHVVHCIWKSFAKQYSTFRSNAHKYYQKVNAEGGITLAKHSIYEKLVNRGDDWLWLCDIWETEKFKKVFETQSNNRAKLKHKHKLGTKSHVAHHTRRTSMTSICMS